MTACVGTYREMLEEYNEGHQIYSGQTIHLILTYGSTTIHMYPKIGTFGSVNFGSSPVQVISGVPSTTEDTITELPAFCTIIEQTGPVNYPIGSPKLLYDLSVSANSLAVVTYDTPSYAYKIKVKQYDQTIAGAVAEYGCGEVNVKLKLNEPWFHDWMGEREIVFEKYMNFVTGQSSESSASQYYVLGSSHGSNGIWAKSSSMPGSNSDFYQLSSIYKTIDGYSRELYYVTFKVTLKLVSGIYYSEIRHVTPSDTEGHVAKVYYARPDSQSGMPNVYIKSVDGGDFSWSGITWGYQWETATTLIHTTPTSSSADSNGFYNYRWVSPGGYYSKPTFAWHLKYGGSEGEGIGIESIKCNDLDDFPIWSPQWHT